MPPVRDKVNALVILDDKAYRNTFAITQRRPLKQNPNTILLSRFLVGSRVRERNSYYKRKKVIQNKVFWHNDTWAGLEAVLEGGPWMIRNISIIFKKWSMDTSLLKEELTRILIRVKLHYVPLQVFEEDGLSLIATFIVKPIRLDSYTSLMCNDSWGRSSFARCLIEVNSEANLLDFVTIGILSLEGNDFIKETIQAEYEWKPPRCETCKIFGHTNDCCPKMIVAAPSVDNTNDGFQHVVNKNRNNKENTTGNKLSKGGNAAKGVPISKGTFIYQPKAAVQTSNGDGARGNVASKADPKPPLNKDGTSTSNVGSTSGKDVPNQPVNQHNKKGSNYPTPRGQGMNGVDKAKMKISNISTPNLFAPLEEDEDDEVKNI
uniref:Uncharacterized protein n=1 Tax=Tanacetum cinerariifolium TaxID=118510 RepID=A0A6L2NRX0_TANCI|nr:hypothetical protein [Tanacetum cinerariifolium]